MKKIFLLFACLGMFTVMAQAQKSCAKSCAKTCSKTAKVADAQGGMDEIAVAKMAALDNTIERRQCADSGTVSYFRKKTCDVSGKVSFAEVNYDADLAQFVNISPSKAMGSEDMNMTQSASKSGKACAKGAKACCSKKGAKTVAKPAMEKAQTKAIKVSNVN